MIASQPADVPQHEASGCAVGVADVAVGQHADFHACVVTSRTELKKKGRFVLELAGSETLQIVTDHTDVVVGDTVRVALPGEKHPDGSIVKQQKIAGEWSQGALIGIISQSKGDVEGIAGHAPELEQDDLDHSDEEDEAGECHGDPSASFHVLSTAQLHDDASEGVGNAGRLHYVSGNAAIASFGKGEKVIAHVCNDQGRWGKGFVMAVSDRWGKGPGKQYRQWHKAGSEAGFRLGAVQMIELTPTLMLANMIGQNGIKTGSKGPPVRYDAIGEAMHAVGAFAASRGASVHMPRIGVGLAGGTWQPIEEILVSVTRQCGIEVYVYDFTK